MCLEDVLYPSCMRFVQVLQVRQDKPGLACVLCSWIHQSCMRLALILHASWMVCNWIASSIGLVYVLHAPCICLARVFHLYRMC